MNTYDFTFILNDEAELSELKKILKSHSGKLVKEHPWGERVFAYPINKLLKSNYYTWEIEIDKKDLKEGYSYIMKDGTEALYLGRHNFNDTYDYGGKTIDEFNPLGKNHIFLNLKKDKYQSPYLIQSGFAKIAECTSSAPLQQFPNEYEKFKKSSYCGDIKELIIEKLEINHPNDLNGFLLLKEDGKYYAAKIQRYYNYNYSSRNKQQYELLRSIDEFIPDLNNKIKNLKVSHYGYFSSSKLAKQDLYSLIAVTENGKKLRVIK